MKIRTLMVEGGARVIASFLESDLVDRLIITTSPQIIGASGVSYNGINKVRFQMIKAQSKSDVNLFPGFATRVS